MTNDTSSIISRFHVSSMCIGIFMIASMGSLALYTILNGHGPQNMQWMQYGILGVCIAWMLFSLKDWMAYYKLSKTKKHLIQDERFVHDSGLASKIAFGFLIFSNFALLMIDLTLHPLNGAFTAIFSLVFGIVAYMASLIYLELRA
ncbi:MAG: hypothetical protein MJK04_35570 [Psychrosphaera sp.]|nr:hypothetical protein [Psychrosphaera sp.]